MATLLTLVLILSSILINSQKIILQDPQTHSPCMIGMRNNMDTFIIAGIVGPHFDTLVSSHWNTEVTVQMHTNESKDFQDFCQIRIGTSGVNCIPHSLQRCYCKEMVFDSGMVHIVVNATAEMVYSEAKFRVKWENINGNFIYSDNIVTVPKIYDAANVSLKLKVNGQTVPTQSSCHGRFKAENQNTVELCCYSSASPCYLKMIFTDFERNSSSCVNYTYMKCRSELIHLKNVFSMCIEKDYYTFSSCSIDMTCLNKTEFGKSTPENEHGKNPKSTHALLIGLLWCMFVLMCLCVCQCVISKCRKGVWCHYLNCYAEPDVIKNEDNDSSLVSASRQANTEITMITTEDESATAITVKTEKSNISSMYTSVRGGDVESSTTVRGGDVESSTTVMGGDLESTTTTARESDT